ncbi:MAG: cysteine peptidase family C39 domain-containing protein [Candidatus Eremiobacterota bacterium]
MPDTIQSTNYSCGAGALRAVLAYYGKDVSEEELMDRLDTDPQHGTPPEALVRVAREFGLKAELKQNMQVADLERAMDQKTPVIVDAQAWREGDELNLPWSQVWESGHYMVAVGVDGKNLYVEDPSLEWSRGVIPLKEFEERWHDYELAPNGSRLEYHRAGIVFSGLPPSPPAELAPVA